MDQTKLAELQQAATAAADAAKSAGGTDEALNKVEADAQKALDDAKALSQNPVNEELARRKDENKRSEKEKAEFSLRKTAERARELGIDVASAVGVSPASEADDDTRPATIGDLKKYQQASGRQTAEQMADTEITDESERALVKEYLTNITHPDPREALKIARSAVNGIKSGRIAEEQARRGRAPSHSSSGSAPARAGDDGDFMPTVKEQRFMQPPFNLTKDQVIAARTQAS